MYRSPHKRGGKKPLRFTREAAVAGSRQFGAGPDHGELYRYDRKRKKLVSAGGPKYSKRHDHAQQPRGMGARGACFGQGKPNDVICYCGKNAGKGH